MKTDSVTWALVLVTDTLAYATEHSFQVTGEGVVAAVLALIGLALLFGKTK